MRLIGIKKILTIVIACLSFSSLFSAEVEFSGIFLEQNMYIKNPTMKSGFCIKGISVNGMSANTNINTGLVVVRFSELGLKSGDKFTMVINHDEAELPIILNKNAFASKSTFTLVSTNMETKGNDSKLYLTIKDESSPMPFYIDHFLSNKWVRLGAIIGKGGMEEKTYELPISNLSGENQLKIYQINDDETIRSFDFTLEIRFTGSTEYMIVDKEYGNIKQRGINKDVDISKLPKAKYFVSYDDKFKKFKKKK